VRDLKSGWNARFNKEIDLAPVQLKRPAPQKASARLLLSVQDCQWKASNSTGQEKVRGDTAQLSYIEGSGKQIIDRQCDTLLEATKK
jgi:hypothetical protein